MDTPSTLFRSEVVAQRPGSLPAGLLLKSGQALRVLLCLLILVMLLALFLLFFIPYKETSNARGILQPAGGVFKLLAPAPARVTALHTSAGKAVSKGQVLLILDTSPPGPQGNAATVTEIEQLRTERESLHREVALQSRLVSVLNEQNDQNRHSLDNKLQLAREELDTLQQQQMLSSNSMQALGSLLEQSAISQRQADEQHYTHLELERQHQRLLQQLVELEHQIRSLNTSRQVREQENVLAALARERRIEQIDTQLDYLDGKDRITLVAETKGMVGEVSVKEGDLVKTGQPLLVLNPDNADLEAELYVSSRVHARLAPGQEVLLSYDGFSTSQYGRYSATISYLGQAVLDPREQLLPVTGLREPVYRIRAQLQQHYVEGPDVYRLQSGMQLTGEFVETERSLFRHVLEPVLKLRGKVF